jgi:hypothetical protein
MFVGYILLLSILYRKNPFGCITISLLKSPAVQQKLEFEEIKFLDKNIINQSIK